MKIINVSLKENPYKIIVGRGILSQLGIQVKNLRLGQDAVIVTHAKLKKLYGAVVEKSLEEAGLRVKFCLVPEGEESKSFESAFKLLNEIARCDGMKKIFVVALGGGVVGDLAGFVAAVYKRGVAYIQVPTSFLAQIDSAIGGKVAVDLPVGKNLVGAFYQPKLVFSDVDVLKTLPQREIRNGLAEAVKYGIIMDPRLFDFIEKKLETLLRSDIESLTRVVERSSQIKTDVVLADEKETKGIRAILNFGHTLGHAIEAAGGYRNYKHGEAIALGMRAACEISSRLKMVSLKDVIRINKVLSDVGLPKKIKGIKLNQILEFMRHDKKFLAGKNRFVLVERIGKVKIVEGVSLEAIEKGTEPFIICQGGSASG